MPENVDKDRLQQWRANVLPVPSAERLKALSAPTGSLDVLIEKWEACAKSWMKLADERSEDPDLADRASARAAIYQDCANDLKENAEVDQHCSD